MDKLATKKINNSLLKIIGFFQYDQECPANFKEHGYKDVELDDATYKFLIQGYHTEYVDRMFNNSHENSVIRLKKKLNIKAQIKTTKNDLLNILLDSVELFFFRDMFQDSQMALFSITYSPDALTLKKISDLSFLLRNPDTNISYNNKELRFHQLISQDFLCGQKFYGDNTEIAKYAGSKFKTYTNMI